MLERLGWGGEAFAFVEAKSASGTLKMDRAALEVIQAIANGGQLAILVKMMETLKKLGDGDRPIRIFDIQARQDLSGNFQIGAAQKGTTARFRSGGPLQRVGQPRNVPVLELSAETGEILDRSAEDDAQPRPLRRPPRGGRRQAESRRGRLCRRTGDRLRKVQLRADDTRFLVSSECGTSLPRNRGSGGGRLVRRHAETNEPIPCPSLRAKRSNPGAAVRPFGSLAAHVVAPGLLRRKGSSQ